MLRLGASSCFVLSEYVLVLLYLLFNSGLYFVVYLGFVGVGRFSVFWWLGIYVCLVCVFAFMEQKLLWLLKMVLWVSVCGFDLWVVLYTSGFRFVDWLCLVLFCWMVSDYCLVVWVFAYFMFVVWWVTLFLLFSLVNALCVWVICLFDLFGLFIWLLCCLLLLGLVVVYWLCWFALNSVVYFSYYF